MLVVEVLGNALNQIYITYFLWSYSGFVYHLYLQYWNTFAIIKLLHILHILICSVHTKQRKYSSRSKWLPVAFSVCWLVVRWPSPEYLGFPFGNAPVTPDIFKKFELHIKQFCNAHFGNIGHLVPALFRFLLGLYTMTPLNSVQLCISPMLTIRQSIRASSARLCTACIIQS